MLVRELIRAAAAAGLVSAVLLASCTGSDDIGFHRSGAGGDAGSGEAGSSSASAGSGDSSGEAGSSAMGAAGSTTSGAAGRAGNTGSGAGAGAGTSGAAGASSSGAAGSSGSNGTAGASGAAGSKGTAGTSGADGTTGTAGSTGAAGAAAGSMVDPGIGCGQIKVYSYSGGIENLLVQNCGGCHYAAPGVNVQGGFSFSYANLTGVTNGHPSCVGLDASKRRIVPGKPDNSLLWIKAYDDSPPSGCGGHMPFMGSRLTMANLCYIRAWIVAGAPP
jgi:hypothetical protein